MHLSNSLLFGLVISCSTYIPIVASAQFIPRPISVTLWSNAGGGGGSSSSVTSSQLQAAFAASASAIHNDSDGAGNLDVACNMNLFQTGSTTFIGGTLSDGDIGDSTEYGFVERGPHFMKVVPKISWCGALSTNIGGCTHKGAANSMIISDLGLQSGAATGGVVIDHEFGHAIGFSHVTGTENVMDPFSNANKVFVFSTQCSSYTNHSYSWDGPGTFTGGTVMGVTAEKVDFSKMSIQELAHTIFLDHDPLEVEDFYGPTDIAILKDMLKEKSEASSYMNIVTLIGLLSAGDDADAASLQEFVAKNPESIAARSAVMSLGHVAQRGSKAAASSLIEYTQDTASPLSKSAILGLALSGRDDALDTIRSHKPTAVRGSKGANNARELTADEILGSSKASPRRGPMITAEFLAEAAATNAGIAAKGRRGYYDDALNK